MLKSVLFKNKRAFKNAPRCTVVQEGDARPRPVRTGNNADQRLTARTNKKIINH